MLGNLVAILEQLCDCSIGESVFLDPFGFEKMRIAKSLVKHYENGTKMAPKIIRRVDLERDPGSSNNKYEKSMRREMHAAPHNPENV